MSRSSCLAFEARFFPIFSPSENDFPRKSSLVICQTAMREEEGGRWMHIIRERQRRALFNLKGNKQRAFLFDGENNKTEKTQI